MPKESFLKNRLKSVIFALKGAWILLRSESSIQIQFVIGMLVTLGGFYYNISSVEWMIQFLAIGLVMGVEGVNTGIEKLSDFVEPEWNDKIGRIKDISAGAVMITSIIATIIGAIIYLPKIF